eukprot:CAMPEP_0113690462 /NCGR_PEP_ID=MMETSP0038_2-20120614/17804_1 /TAXON_ID=2898 /ORGANISM="Cryptomonas paramecium" /LENGTH=294 /DNA_ID=CAMNT_0000611789 /DNA_START=52 /DNA_END=933 /DNA_ORIENTATION=- /assembly_acc=CAM_ASM_000170
MNSSLTLKVSYQPLAGDKETRRFAFSSAVAFEEVLETVATRFGVAPSICRLEYEDEDGDIIAVDSDSELRCALSASSVLRMNLKIVEKTTVKMEQATPDPVMPTCDQPLPVEPDNKRSENISLCVDYDTKTGDEHKVLDQQNQVPDQELTDYEFALKLQSEENAVSGRPPCSTDDSSKCNQHLEDEGLARALQEEENELTSGKRYSVMGAAAIGAGVGLLAGGALLALAGAGIGAVSASEEGRRNVGEVARNTGRALSTYGQSLTEASSRQSQRLRSAAEELKVRAEDARRAAC